MSKAKAQEVETQERTHQVRYHTTQRTAAFLGWAKPQLGATKWQLIDMAISLLHEKLSEIYDEVPGIDVGEYDYDQLLNEKGTD